MESLAVFVDEEWDNLSRMFSSEEEYSDQHFALQLHGNGIFSGERGHDMMINIETPSSFWPSTDHESSNANAPIFDEGLFLNYYFSQETSTHSSDTSTNTNLFLPTPTHGDGNYHHADSNLITHHLTPNHSFSDHRSMDFYTMGDNNNNNMLSQVFSDDVMEEILCLKQTNVEKAKMEHSDSQKMATADPAREMQLKRKFEMPDHELPEATKDDVVKIDPVDKNPKKKQRVSKDNKTKKNAQSKKNGQKLASETDGNDGEVETNNGGAGNGQSSSSCSSEDHDSNSNSNESNGGALNLNGKTRAGRGAATDPQSLYARKRRERINERLRILQNLVPNGTKIDISTMLEEAVHYVKFLQLQIKLLSSDDMWMYAPIAYNGMDMGLYQKISSTQ